MCMVGWQLCYQYTWSITIKNEALFSDTKIVSGQSVFWGLDAEMINKIKLDGVPLDAISDLESPDYKVL
jgi:starch synthase